MSITLNNILSNNNSTSPLIISGHTFSNEIISEENMWICSLIKLSFLNCTFSKVNLEGSYCAECEFENCIFNNTYFRKSTFEDCVFKNCQIIDSKLPRVSFTSIMFTNCKFERVSFSGSEFDYCQLVNINFTETSFYGVFMSDSKFCQLNMCIDIKEDREFEQILKFLKKTKS